MARQLSVNVVVLDEQQNPLVLESGSEVPAWATDQVGDHCFAKQDPPEDAEDKPARKPQSRSTK